MVEKKKSESIINNPVNKESIFTNVKKEYQLLLFTNIGFNLSDTSLTLDRAAPLKLTPTLLFPDTLLDVVTTPTAHLITAIRTKRIAIALTTTRPISPNL